MTVVLAIDPGSQLSGWVAYFTDNPRPVDGHGKEPNQAVLEQIQRGDYDVLVVEWMESSFGSHIGKEVTETLWWVGRFCQAAEERGIPFARVGRNKLRHHLTGKATANDTMIRGALVDRFGGIGGRSAAVGTMKAPGPLHGIAADEWQALAVAVTWADQR
jgi:hypothetical protein